MTSKDKRPASVSHRLAIAKLTPPDWYGWLGVLAMLLLPVVRVQRSGGAWFFPLLSLGEWLLLPLGVASLVMGFLSLSRIREKTLLPLWISAVVPAALWLAAAGTSALANRVSSAGVDIFLSWSVHLIFPTLAFLPLVTMRIWRDRLMWALAAGLAVNAVFAFWQMRSAGAAPPDVEVLRFGGFLANQHDYGLALALALPLLAAWRGGEHASNKALATLFCTFLLPALALSACFSWGGLLAAGVGIVIAWAAWRSHAWLLGVFLCLLIFGYGAASHFERDGAQRRLLADSAFMGGDCYRRAFNTFRVRPFLGSGPEVFCPGDGHQPLDTCESSPWFATLLGGGGLAALGMWVVFLGELAARTMGRFGGRCIWHGGVLGGVAALGVSGFWTDSLPEGAGALVGFLVALSILEEPEVVPARRRSALSEDAASLSKDVSKSS